MAKKLAEFPRVIRGYTRLIHVTLIVIYIFPRFFAMCARERERERERKIERKREIERERERKSKRRERETER